MEAICHKITSEQTQPHSNLERLVCLILLFFAKGMVVHRESMKSNSSCSIPWTSVGAAETVIRRLLLYLCSSKISRQVTEQKQHCAGKSVGAMTSNFQPSLAKPCSQALRPSQALQPSLQDGGQNGGIHREQKEEIFCLRARDFAN